MVLTAEAIGVGSPLKPGSNPRIKFSVTNIAAMIRLVIILPGRERERKRSKEIQATAWQLLLVEYYQRTR